MEEGTSQLHHEMCDGQLVRMSRPKDRRQKDRALCVWKDGNAGLAAWRALLGIHPGVSHPVFLLPSLGASIVLGDTG